MAAIVAIKQHNDQYACADAPMWASLSQHLVHGVPNLSSFDTAQMKKRDAARKFPPTKRSPRAPGLCRAAEFVPQIQQINAINWRVIKSAIHN
jgi:hypothetical protein